MPLWVSIVIALALIGCYLKFSWDGIGGPPTHLKRLKVDRDGTLCSLSPITTEDGTISVSASEKDRVCVVIMTGDSLTHLDLTVDQARELSDILDAIAYVREEMDAGRA